MVGWKGWWNVDVLVCHCRSLWWARQSILSILLSMWCRCGGLRVDPVELPVEYYVEVDCCSNMVGSTFNWRSSARICTLCPRFQRMTQDPEDELHIFVCPLYEPLKGSYPRVFSSRAYWQCYIAHESKLSEVDDLFRTFLTQGGPEFWSQLAEFLIACRNARLTFQDDFRTNRGDLDDFSDTDDEAV